MADDRSKRRGDTGDSNSPGQEGKKEFDLWRLLTTPEELGDDSSAAFRPEPAAREAVPDIDEAITRDAAEQVVYCRNHPETVSIGQCPVCAAYYCNDCLVIKKGRLMCRTCAEATYAPSEEEVIELGEKAYAHRGDFLPDAPPEFNPGGFGVNSEGRVANVFKRIIAYVLDVVIARLLYFVGFFLVTFLLAGLSRGAVPTVISLGEGNMIEGSKMVLTSLFRYQPLPVVLILDFLYFFGGYAIANRSLGMSWMNLRIVSQFGDFVGIGAAAIRAAVLVATFGFSIIVALVHPRAAGLHDMAAGTYVINYSGLKRVDVYEIINVKF
jgi:uncharacterized RDD family membrane protein YckC